MGYEYKYKYKHCKVCSESASKYISSNLRMVLNLKCRYNVSLTNKIKNMKKEPKKKHLELT